MIAVSNASRGWLAPDVLVSAQEAESIRNKAASATVVGLLVPPQDAKQVREQLGVTQAAFSGQFGIPLATIKHWEKGRRTPDQAANVLLYLISRMPTKIERCLRQSGQQINATGQLTGGGAGH